jgi:hypothetical protein
MQRNDLFKLSRLKHTKSLFWLAVLSVAGAVVTYLANTRNRIGTSTVAGETTKAQLITLQL